MREPNNAPTGKVVIEGSNTHDRRKRIIDAAGKDWVTSCRKVITIRGVVSSNATKVNQAAEKTIEWSLAATSSVELVEFSKILSSPRGKLIPILENFNNQMLSMKCQNVSN